MNSDNISKTKEEIISEMSNVYYDIKSAKRFMEILSSTESDVKPSMELMFGYNSFSTQMERKSLISFLEDFIIKRNEYLNELTNKLRKQI